MDKLSSAGQAAARPGAQEPQAGPDAAVVSAAVEAFAATAAKHRHHAYWRRTLRLTAALLFLCCAVTFGVSYFARDLNFSFFGWPFSFWMAAQGALIVYCLIVWAYARGMERLDHEFGVAEEG
jgi:putative solute:sodium symporter small subunit